VTTTLATKGADLEFKEGTQFTVECNGPTRKKKVPTSAIPRQRKSTHPIAEQPSRPTVGSYRIHGQVSSQSGAGQWHDYASRTSVAFAHERGYALYEGRPDFRMP